MPVNKLISGYRGFHAKYFESDSTLYRELSGGQSPKTLVIACSDSRVDPSIVTGSEPGDIFVVRNVANLVPPYEKNTNSLHGISAALEFGVCVLKVEHIIVLGHSGCAGIAALLAPETVKDTDFIAQWVNIGMPARDRAKAQAISTGQTAQHCCEQSAIQLSLHNLTTFPWIREKLEAETLKLHGWHFALDDGELQQYNPQTDAFEVV